MAINKRKTIGMAILSATGAQLFVGCGEKAVTSGNLMAPEMVDLCIEVEPESAAVTVDGTSVDDGSCVSVYEYTTVSITAIAEGYDNYEEELLVETDTTHTITMTATNTDTGSTDTGNTDSGANQ